MKTSVFVAFSLCILSGLAMLSGELKVYFNRPEKYLHQIQSLKEDLKRERAAAAVAQYEFEEFRGDIARLLPQAIEKKGPGEKSYELRQLASVVKPGSPQKLDFAQARKSLEVAKREFGAKKFVQAIFLLNAFVNKHPYSPNLAEGYFLMAEAQFQSRHFEDCVATVDKMLTLFPENELTGFSLLRVGKIYEYQDRADEAVDIYRLVLNTFSQGDVALQARASLQAVEF